MNRNLYLLFLCSFLVFSERVASQNIAINSTGAAAGATNMFEVTQSSTAAYMVALHAIHNGLNAGADSGYAFKAVKSLGTGHNVAAYFSATGGASNSAIIVPRNRGFVGLGTTNPRGILHIENGEAKLTAYDTDVAGPSLERPAWQMGAGGRQFVVRSSADYAAYTDRMVISPYGNVGIGIATPLSLLHLAADTALRLNTPADDAFPAITAATRGTGGEIRASSGANSDYGTLILSAGGETGLGNKMSLVIKGYGVTDNTQARFLAGNTALMTIRNSGWVGIGTTDPTLNTTGRVLHLHEPSTAASVIHLTNSTTGSAAGNGFIMGRWNDGSYGDGVIFWNYAATPMTFSTNSAQRMYIHGTTGNVGIGTSTSPAFKLDVQGAIGAGNSDMYFTNTTHTHTGTGNTAGYAAIENASDYDALMILGRAGTAVGRKVRLWDYLQINGNSDITGTLAVGRSTLNAGASLHVQNNLVVGDLAAGSQQTLEVVPGGGDVKIGSSTQEGDLFIRNMAAGNNVHFSGGSTSHYINSGSFGIGTTTPGFKLDIQGGDLNVSNASGGYFRTNAETDLLYSGGADAFFIFQHANAAGTTAFFRNSAWAPISASAFVVSSARRFKRDFRDLHYGLKDILKLQPKEYKYISDSTRNEVGFIAEEVLSIIPEVVYFNDVTHEVLGIDYGKFSSILVKSIQEQQQQIQKLQFEVVGLRAENQDLKSDFEIRLKKLEQQMGEKVEK